MPADAAAVRGLSSELLAAPRFAEIADEFLAFVGDAPLVAHNADFDYLNAEPVVDTLLLARRMLAQDTHLAPPTRHGNADGTPPTAGTSPQALGMNA
jgi:DNA polymerase-3 subunit epsilon